MTYFTDHLEKLGLEKQVAKTIAREAVLKAKRKLRPRGHRTATITIEDSYKVDKKIKIFDKSGKADPKEVLARYIENRKGYPPLDRFDIEEAFGLGGIKAWHCTFIPRSTVTSGELPKPDSVKILEKAAKMTSEDRAKLIEQLKRSVNAE